MKRFVSLLMVIVMIAMIGGCSSSKKSAVTAVKSTAAANTAEEKVAGGTAFPISKEPITLKCFAASGVYTKGDFNELAIWKEYEKKTNVKVQFEAYPMGQHKEKFSLKMASKDLPDFIYKVALPVNDVMKYSNDGTFASISPYLEKYAPNYSKQMSIVPNMRPTVTMSDNKIYGFCYLVTAAPAQTLPIFYNAKWLEKLGMQMPTTLDGLKALLLKVRDTDLNGNGKADEVPLISNHLKNLLGMFRGSFGLNTRGYTAVDIDIGPDGKLRYIPASDGYKQLLMYMNDLYVNKLIYQQIFDATIPAVTALGEQNQLFMGGLNLRSYLGEAHKDDFAGVMKPFVGPNGKELYSVRYNAVSNMNTFITTANKNPEATVRWIDHFYSDEGIRMYFMGIEGKTYEMDSQGRPKYTQFVTKNPDGLNIEEVLGKYVSWSGGSNPSIAEDVCFGSNNYPELETNVAKSLLKYGPTEVWGSFSYSMEDTTRMTTMLSDINTYVNEATAKFITGSVSFKEWDNYVATLKKMRVDDLIGIYQRGLDDYNKKVQK